MNLFHKIIIWFIINIHFQRYNKLVADQSVIDREFGAFADVPDNFPKYVISMDLGDFSREGIIHKNAIRFLLEDY